MLWRPVTFEANANPTFDAAHTVDEDEERRLDDDNKLWYEERVAGREKDKRIIERGGRTISPHTMRWRTMAARTMGVADNFATHNGAADDGQWRC